MMTTKMPNRGLISSILLFVLTLSAAAGEIETTGWNRPHFRRRCCSPPCPAAPQPMPEQPDQPEEPVPEIDLDSALAGPLSPATGPRGAPHMIGDFLGTMFSVNQGPAILGFRSYRVGGLMDQPVLAPTAVRNFKVAENQCTLPIDRVYSDYVYFNDLGSNSDTQLERYIFGFERTFFEGNASFGLRVPFNVVEPGLIDNGASEIGNFGVGKVRQGDIGDLTGIFKLLLSEDLSTGNAWSGGVAVTAPTGPNTVADVDEVFIPQIEHNGTIQPFFAHLRFLGNGWFMQYFLAADIPFDDSDATFLFNDFGVGNIIELRGPCLTAIVPTFEIHANNPLNNRLIAADQFIRRDQLFVFDQQSFFLEGEFVVKDQVNALAGVTFEFYDRSTLALGLVAPLGNEPIYDWELQLQFNLFAVNPLGGFGPRY